MSIHLDTLAERFRLLRRRILPDAMTRIPKEEELDLHRHTVASKIAARQAEGSVLLSVGRFDMSGVDLFEDEEVESAD